MIKKADTKVVIKKRIELEDSLQDKITNPKKILESKKRKYGDGYKCRNILIRFYRFYI